LPGLLCALYDGRAGLGLRTLADAGRLSVAQDALAAAKAAAARDSYGLLALFSHYEGRADGDRSRRDALLADLGDALSAALRGSPLLPRIPPEAAALRLPPVADARAALRGNSAPKLTFAALTVRLAQAGAH
jgi:DNA polymerase-3 subunit delta'